VPAVHGWRGKNFRRAEHRHGAHAARARRQGSAVKATQSPAVVAADEPATAPRIEETSFTQSTEPS
jgi:hypothetical protein